MGAGSGIPRRHLSSSARAALASTRLIEIVPAGPSRLHSSAPPRFDEPPVVLHALWAPVHPRRADGSDARTPRRGTYALHPGVAPRRGPRPGRRPRPVVPFDIPIEAFAVEVSADGYPAIRSLGDRRLVYVEHRHALRRAYRRRQLLLATGLAGAFVAVAGVALAPGGSVTSSAGAAPASAPGAAPAGTDPARPVRAVGAVGAVRMVMPVMAKRAVAPDWRRFWTSASPAPTTVARPAAAVATGRPDRDEIHARPPYVLGFHGRPLASDLFLVCTRQYESVHAGGYDAVSPGGQYRGAYQFDQPTWDATARYLARDDLVGADPAATEPAVQDLLAYTLYKWQGASHWQYRCDGLP